MNRAIDTFMRAMRQRNGNQPPTPVQMARGFETLTLMVDEEFIKDVVYDGERPRGHIRRKNGKDLFNPEPDVEDEMLPSIIDDGPAGWTSE